MVPVVLSGLQHFFSLLLCASPCAWVLPPSATVKCFVLTSHFRVVTPELHCSLCHMRLVKTSDLKDPGRPPPLHRTLRPSSARGVPPRAYEPSQATDRLPSAPKPSRVPLWELVLPHSVVTLSSSLCSLQASERHPARPQPASHSPPHPRPMATVPPSQGEELPDSTASTQPCPFPSFAGGVASPQPISFTSWIPPIPTVEVL